MTVSAPVLRADAAPGNRLLAALPPIERAQLLSALVPVQLTLGAVLYEPGQAITHVYFPLTALVSLLTVLQDGGQVEMAAVGHEGLVGVPLVLRSQANGHRAMVQIAGTALQLEADAFQAAQRDLAGLGEILLRYAQLLLTQVGQQAACNSRHLLTGRCARWLLEASDRVGADVFFLTQHFLAAMLDVRRPSVTVAAGRLQQAGLITYHRGQVTILDRPRLEEAACECHGFLVGETDRLLGPAEPSSPVEALVI